MKGPANRLKIDLRRTWECPVCQRRERTAGSVTANICMCRTKQAEGKPVVMRLVEDGARRVTLPGMSKKAVAIPAAVEPTPTEITSESPEVPVAAAVPDAPASGAGNNSE